MKRRIAVAMLLVAISPAVARPAQILGARKVPARSKKSHKPPQQRRGPDSRGEKLEESKLNQALLRHVRGEAGRAMVHPFEIPEIWLEPAGRR